MRRLLFYLEIAGLLQGRITLGHSHGKGEAAGERLDGGVGRRRLQRPVRYKSRKCDDRDDGDDHQRRDAVFKRAHRCTGRVLT